MKVIDPFNLMSEKSLISEVINNHPFCSNLSKNIRNVTVRSPEQRYMVFPSIEYDFENHNVTLILPKETAEQSNLAYILYHEFAHVADKLNPLFRYSEDGKDALSDVQQQNLMELWNLFIDARLNAHNLFELGEIDRNVYCEVGGKRQKLPFAIEGKLLKHRCFLHARGIEKAEEIVNQIWNHPHRFVSYPDMIAVVQFRYS